MAVAWPLGLGRSPESKDGDEKAASKGTVDGEAKSMGTASHFSFSCGQSVPTS